MSSLLEQASVIITPNAYKAGKLYGLKGTDLDVVRATTATRVNESGLIESVANNVPRLDYTGGGCPSILVEPQRTNLFTYSEEFDNSSWINDNSTENANATNSPSGLNDAYSLIENTATSQHSIYKVGVSVSSGAVVTLSFFAKQNTRKFIGVNDPYTGNGAFFDLENGTALGDIGTISSKVIENYGNGWYRCSVTFQASGTLTGGQIFISPNGTTGIYAGNGTSGIFLWGAQLEQGSYATSYIPTVASAVTRNADVISKTGIADLIGQTEGTIYAEVDFDINIGGVKMIEGLASNGSNFIYLFIDGSTTVCNIFSAGSAQCSLQYILPLSGQYKIAVTYKNNDFAMYVNGTQVAIDTSGSVPTCSILYLGNDFLSVYNKIAYNAIALWKTRLTNAELATLTSL